MFHRNNLWIAKIIGFISFRRNVLCLLSAAFNTTLRKGSPAQENDPLSLPVPYARGRHNNVQHRSTACSKKYVFLPTCRGYLCSNKKVLCPLLKHQMIRALL